MILTTYGLSVQSGIFEAPSQSCSGNPDGLLWIMLGLVLILVSLFFWQGLEDMGEPLGCFLVIIALLFDAAAIACFLRALNVDVNSLIFHWFGVNLPYPRGRLCRS